MGHGVFAVRTKKPIIEEAAERLVKETIVEKHKASAAAARVAAKITEAVGTLGIPRKAFIRLVEDTKMGKEQAKQVNDAHAKYRRMLDDWS